MSQLTYPRAGPGYGHDVHCIAYEGKVLLYIILFYYLCLEGTAMFYSLAIEIVCHNHVSKNAVPLFFVSVHILVFTRENYLVIRLTMCSAEVCKAYAVRITSCV